MIPKYDPDGYPIAPKCNTCGLPKKPSGRDALATDSYCNHHECKGYWEFPLPGQMWPSEALQMIRYEWLERSLTLAESALAVKSSLRCNEQRYVQRALNSVRGSLEMLRAGDTWCSDCGFALEGGHQCAKCAQWWEENPPSAECVAPSSQQIRKEARTGQTPKETP